MNLKYGMVFGFCLWGAAVLAQAQETFPGLKVLPWNGHKAATSLTFDDGDPSHLDTAVPELNQRKMKATFFLIANKVDRKDEWRKILTMGHEIGNHTLDHKHATELTPQDEEAQVVGANNVLQKEFGFPVYSFAYPYLEVSPGLRNWVGKTDFLARGGGYALITPDSNIDWLNIPSRMTMTDTPFSTYQQWIDEDFQKGAWLVWMIHGLEGTPWGYQPIAKKVFEMILDTLQSKDIWVGTFLEVGSYLRAQKAFENSSAQRVVGEETLSWSVPDHFPLNVYLQVSASADGGNFEIWQGSQKIPADSKGVYKILFNTGKLMIRHLPNG